MMTRSTDFPQASPSAPASTECGAAHDGLTPPLSDERRSLQAFVDRVVNDREVIIRYQPVVGLADGRVLGFEALTQWRSPTPRSATPDASPGGEIGAPMRLIERWLVHDACRWARAWGAGAGDTARVSVKIPACELKHSGFGDDLAAMLRAAGLSPADVVLELSPDPGCGNLGPAFERLHGHGFRLAVGNFGSDFGALRYLVRLPIESVKLDRSLTDRIPFDEEAAGIAGRLIGMAHSLGLRAMAEGLANRKQLNCLQAVGCDWGEGPLLGESMDPQAAGRLLSRPLLTPVRPQVGKQRIR